MNRLRFVAALLVAAGLLGGCGGSEDEVQTAQAICASIEADLAAQTGVTSATVTFLHTSVNPGDAGAVIEVAEGADEAALTEQATRLIWRSGLDPLRRISVTVGSGAPDASYALPEGATELAAKFGDRPHTDREVDQGSVLLLLAAVAAGALALLIVLVGLIVYFWRRSARARG